MIEPVTELFFDNAWHDITVDVYNRDVVTINRGRADETSQVNAGRMTLTLDNRTGRYSPRNPRSDLFGKIGRNTPLRVRIGEAQLSSEVRFFPGGEAHAGTPDNATLDITGDIDLRIDVEPDDWNEPDGIALARKYFTGGQRSWIWWIDSGEIRFRWSTDGTATETAVSEPIDFDGRMGLRVTLDVDDVLNHTVTFYTADTIAGPWIQFGAPVTNLGTTSIFASTTDVEIGQATSEDIAGVGVDHLVGVLNAFELRDGIDGTEVANPDCTALASLDPTFVDAAGRTWTLVNLGITVRDPSLRFVGEVASWPQQWSPAGADVYAQIEVAGILRRLGQGQPVVKSPLSIYMPTTPGLVAYWPMEDQSGSTQLAPGFGTDEPIALTGEPELGTADMSDVPGSSPLPVFSGNWIATVPPFTVVDDNWDIGFLFRFSGDTISTARFIVDIALGGSGVAKRILVSVDPAGVLRIRVFDEDGALLEDQLSVPIPEIIFGQWVAFRFARLFEDVGGNAFFIPRVRGMATGEETLLGAAVWSQIGTPDVPVKLSTDLTAGNVTDDPRSIGHVYVNSNPTALATVEPFFGPEAFGFRGETAGNRILRIGDENDVPVGIIGDPAGTTSMGAQPIATVLDIFQECELADQGIFYEARESISLRYRTRVDLYDQDPALLLPYGAGVFRSAPTPVDDDQRTRNDITVTRQGGSSARAQKLTGALSVEPPPDGVGRYDEGLTVNLAADGQLANDVSWRLSLGTVDEARYPSLHLQLIAPAYTANPELTADAVAVDIGDRIVINDPPEWLPPERISVLVQGFTESFSLITRDIIVNTAPESPYQVAEYEAAEGGTYRYDTAGTLTVNNFTSGTDTSMLVDVDVLPLWTTDPAEFPFDIELGGVRLTVTAIVGTTPLQTFTIAQAPVNGIVKTMPAGTAVSLWTKARYAL